MTRTSELIPQGAGDAADPAPCADPDAGADRVGRYRAGGDSAAAHGEGAAAAAAALHPAPRVLLVDSERSLAGLIDEWLGAAGCHVTQAAEGGAADAGTATEERYDLVIVDVPFPRRGGVDLIGRITKRHPMTPILALSSSFFAGVDCCGAVARTLGVAGVCPWPASRETLIDAARRFLPLAR